MSNYTRSSGRSGYGVTKDVPNSEESWPLATMGGRSQGKAFGLGRAVFRDQGCECTVRFEVYIFETLDGRRNPRQSPSYEP